MSSITGQVTVTFTDDDPGVVQNPLTAVQKLNNAVTNIENDPGLTLVSQDDNNKTLVVDVDRTGV